MALDESTGIFCETTPAAPGGDKELAPIVMIPGLGGGAGSFEPLLGSWRITLYCGLSFPAPRVHRLAGDMFRWVRWWMA
ncbi:MAG: hypothetical protein R3D29_03490 [Nitratireductor sp.]